MFEEKLLKLLGKLVRWWDLISGNTLYFGGDVGGKQGSERGWFQIHDQNLNDAQVY